jgi:hypothetical protein
MLSARALFDVFLLRIAAREYRRLIENSISLDTWNVYDKAVKTLESFRCEMSLEHK